MNKYPLIGKCVAVGIILFFVGIGIIPMVSSLSMEKDIIDIKTCAYGSQDNDTTPPYTTISLNGTMGENGWYVSDVMVTLNATDDDSGVNVTYYQIDDGVWQLYTIPFPLFTDGMHPIGYYSVDNMGNIEPEQSVQCNIDQTAPTVNLSIKLGLGLFPDSFIANCDDETSGMDRVEFNPNCFPSLIDYEEPFEFPVNGIPTDEFYIIIDAVAFDAAGNHNRDRITLPLPCHFAVGLISNPEFAPSTVTFFALLIHTDSGLIMFKQVTFPYSDSYYGYIGRFFIRAIFI